TSTTPREEGTSWVDQSVLCLPLRRRTVPARARPVLDAPITITFHLTSARWARWMGTPPGAVVVLRPPPTPLTRPAELVVDLVAHWGGDNAMTTPTAAGHRGFRHELFLHRSTAELLEFVVPLVR